MYDEMWHWLPGPVWAKVVTCVVLLACVVALCFSVIYPWIGEHAPSMTPGATVDEANSAPAPAMPAVATDGTVPQMTLR